MANPLKKRVLVIDDDHAVLTDYRRVLAPLVKNKLGGAASAFFGGSTTPAAAAAHASIDVDCTEQGASGVEAVQRARDEGRPYTVVFVDMRMPPGIDGCETIRRIRAVDPALPCIVCTAFSDVDAEVLRREFGLGLAVLHKPFDPAEIRALVESSKRTAA